MLYSIQFLVINEIFWTSIIIYILFLMIKLTLQITLKKNCWKLLIRIMIHQWNNPWIHQTIGEKRVNESTVLTWPLLFMSIFATLFNQLNNIVLSMDWLWLTWIECIFEGSTLFFKRELLKTYVIEEFQIFYISIKNKIQQRK